jgi:peptidoglycan/xylan/chitin deacetylase (PgdA/CDA1 family)
MRNELLVLMYHRILPEGEHISTVPFLERPYTIRSDVFSGHLDVIGRSGWSVVGPERVAVGTSGGRLLVTFDDSRESHYTVALPALVQCRMSAVFFVSVGEIGTPGCVSWEQLADMRDAGMSIQSHGCTHRHMTMLSDEELGEELRRSKVEIESRLGTTATMLSFPGGRYDHRVMEAGLECGYSVFFGSDVGLNHNGVKRVHKRVAVTGGMSAERLSRILRSPKVALLPLRIRYGATRVARTLLGEGLYGRLRGAALKRIT